MKRILKWLINALIKGLEAGEPEGYVKRERRNRTMTDKERIKDHSEAAREHWPRQSGERAYECGCGRMFGKDDLLECSSTPSHEGCVGHCPYCGQQVRLMEKVEVVKKQSRPIGEEGERGRKEGE
jgi:hypothetical protein